MDSVSPAAIDPVNRILEMATQAVINQSEKLMKVSVEMAVGTELGKGQAIDVSA